MVLKKHVGKNDDAKKEREGQYSEKYSYQVDAHLAGCCVLSG